VTDQSSQPALCVEQVSKRFQLQKRDFVAVEEVSFAVNSGDIGVLLGPSGCGKSTLLRMVAGLEPYTAGRISLNGRLVTGPGADRGMVFQTYTSFPWLSVKANVEFGLQVSGQLRALRQGMAEYFIERVGLADFKDAYPDQLSGGMRQRIALARALANGPELLLMDEPFGALDPETRWQMQELLDEIVSKENMTVLLVTHDIEEALYLADNIVLLASSPGRVRQQLRPKLRAEQGFCSKTSILTHPEYSGLYNDLRATMLKEAVPG